MKYRQRLFLVNYARIAYKFRPFARGRFLLEKPPTGVFGALSCVWFPEVRSLIYFLGAGCPRADGTSATGALPAVGL